MEAGGGSGFLPLKGITTVADICRLRTCSSSTVVMSLYNVVFGVPVVSFTSYEA